jgi:hypothetical protein
MSVYVVDIDGTICISTHGSYQDAEPIPEHIMQINALYEQGNFIIYFTARGMGSSNNNSFSANEKWFDLTRKQLVSWGAKHHKLILGKPSGDFYIDDKAIQANDFFTKKNL